jgi:hypothetical protein
MDEVRQAVEVLVAYGAPSVVAVRDTSQRILGVDPAAVSPEDRARLAALGFVPDGDSFLRATSPRSPAADESPPGGRTSG